MYDEFKNKEWLTPAEAERFVKKNGVSKKSRHTIRGRIKTVMKSEPENEMVRTVPRGSKGEITRQVHIDLLRAWYNIRPEEEEKEFITDPAAHEVVITDPFIKHLLEQIDVKDKQIQGLQVLMSQKILNPGPKPKQGFWSKVFGKDQRED